jgi:hypothetical protein
MSRALDVIVGAVIALALVCWALLLVVSGTSGRHNPPPADGRDPRDPPA